MIGNKKIDPSANFRTFTQSFPNLKLLVACGLYDIFPSSHFTLINKKITDMSYSELLSVKNLINNPNTYIQCGESLLHISCRESGKIIR